MLLQQLLISAIAIASCLADVPESMKECEAAWNKFAPPTVESFDDNLSNMKARAVQLFAKGQVRISSRKDPKEQQNVFSFWGLFACENKILKHVACRMGDADDKDLEQIIPINRYYVNTVYHDVEDKANKMDYHVYACREEETSRRASKWDSVVTSAWNSDFVGRRRGSEERCRRVPGSAWCGLAKDMVECRNEWFAFTKTKTAQAAYSLVEMKRNNAALEFYAEFTCKEKKVVLKNCYVAFPYGDVPIGSYFFHNQLYYNCRPMKSLSDLDTALSITSAKASGLSESFWRPVTPERLKVCNNEWLRFMANNGIQRLGSRIGSVEIVKAIQKADGTGYEHRSFWLKLDCKGEQLRQAGCEFGQRTDDHHKVETESCMKFGGWIYSCGRFLDLAKAEEEITVTKSGPNDPNDCAVVEAKISE